MGTWQETRIARRVDDHPAAAGTHVSNRVLGTEEDGFEVNVQTLVPVVFCDLQDHRAKIRVLFRLFLNLELTQRCAALTERLALGGSPTGKRFGEPCHQDRFLALEIEHPQAHFARNVLPVFGNKISLSRINSALFL